jgi:hypothetical protein
VEVRRKWLDSGGSRSLGEEEEAATKVVLGGRGASARRLVDLGNMRYSTSQRRKKGRRREYSFSLAGPWLARSDLSGGEQGRVHDGERRWRWRRCGSRYSRQG